MTYQLLNKMGQKSLQVSRPLAAAALLFSTAGSVLLTGGAAHAVSCNSAPFNNGMDFTILGSVPTLPSMVDCMDSGVNLTQVATTYMPPLSMGATGYSSFKIDAAPGYYFTMAALDVTIGTMGSGESVTKEIYSDAGFTNLLTSFTSTNGSNVSGQVIPGNWTTIYVKDIYDSQASGVINSYANKFQQTAVPGPLPILGAGAAFGFSRKLRHRIKKASA